MRRLLAAFPLLAAPLAAQPLSDAALEARARAIHDRVLTLDTHVDISPLNFQPGQPNYAERLPRTQVDLEKMAAGGLDAAFLIVYVGQGPLDSAGYARANAQALEKFAAIHRLADSLAPAKVGLARTSADARRIAASGRRVVFIGVENGYPIGTDVTNVKKFADLGARYLSLAHNGHSQLSDSNTGERDGQWLHNGLSPLGRQVVQEANRHGIMLDVSHPSRESMAQTLALTKAPIIASHSGVRAICDHSRNLDDDQLKALARNGGVAQLVAFASYVKCDPKADGARAAQRAAATEALYREFGIPPPAAGVGPGAMRAARAQADSLAEPRRGEFQAKERELAQRFAGPAVTVKDFVDHVDHAVKLIGVDHVGISSDFDGGGGVDGWRSADETLNVTRELVRRGYTEPQIAKMWSGNLLRVLDRVQAVARDLQRSQRTAARE
ncbi:membrane dipeptidase [Roseisolibacter sp. H3M3-2]|uniref:dipeptidase n=1 Tax=Roseisolibacter sp. H3M3-2 TaxID=3031323 RepID=UPI0023DA51A4|nr:membrane dipeptidase [Roseisolibacter sp. H3M3-2]MDF1504454.1 membrane dipeptidase [Roseisolibacter sp. H3M3-2]